MILQLNVIQLSGRLNGKNTCITKKAFYSCVSNSEKIDIFYISIYIYIYIYIYIIYNIYIYIYIYIIYIYIYIYIFIANGHACASVLLLGKKYLSSLSRTRIELFNVLNMHICGKP